MVVTSREQQLQFAERCAPSLFSQMHQTMAGGYFNGMYCQRRFDPLYLELSINSKVTLAAYLTLLSFQQYTQNKQTLLKSDNTTAIANINKMGSMTNQFCDEIIHKIWDFIISNNSWLTLTHIPGYLNMDSDFASGHFNDRTEWTIDDETFRHILAIYPNINCDFWLIWFINQRALYMVLVSSSLALSSLASSMHTSLWCRLRHRNFIFGIHMHICPPFMHIKYLVILACSFKWQPF